MRTENREGRVDDGFIPSIRKNGGMDPRTLCKIGDRILAGQEAGEDDPEYVELLKDEPVTPVYRTENQEKLALMRRTPRTRNGVASSLYYLIKLEANLNRKGGGDKVRVREVGDLLMTTDLRDVFIITKDGEVHAPHMKTVALQIVGPSLTKRWAGGNGTTKNGSHSRGMEVA